MRYRGDDQAVDLKQLKQYIISNRSRIRLIIATDYQTLIGYSASQIKTSKHFRSTSPDTLSALEKSLFSEHQLFAIRLDRVTAADIPKLALLSHAVVFEKQVFYDPSNVDEVANIADGEVRRSFILQLFHTMTAAEVQLRGAFDRLTQHGLQALLSSRSTEEIHARLETAFAGPGGGVVRSYVLWGIEMNYLPPLLTSPETLTGLSTLTAFLRDPEKPDAFVLSSAYSLLNKSFFLRTLEDSQTENTKFFNGEIAWRYLSDGILAAKYKEGGNDTLIAYLRELFQFRRPDLAPFSFLLRRDTFSWVLDELEPSLFVRIVRLFNDVNFRKLNQDILGDIYEHYLEQERPDGKKSYRQILGQYYTPKPIVRLMWRLVQDVLKTTRGRNLYDAQLPLLRVLDPCYGSGTFLCEALLQMNASGTGKPINKDGRVHGFLGDRVDRRRAEDFLTGFEINPLSKSIADVNLFFSLVQAYGPTPVARTPVQRLRLFRTDSLGIEADEKSPKQSLPLYLFAEDVQQATRDNTAIIDAKAARFDIVIANPPYAPAENAEEMVESLIPFAIPRYNFDHDGRLTPFRHDAPRIPGKVPNHEKNRGKLKDLYALFFGAADRLCDDAGIVAYITSNTWLAIPTYKFFRKYFLENYTIHYLVNFNNISDRSSMFAPDAGIATAIVVMTKGAPQAGHLVRYLDLSELGSTRERFDSIAQVKWKGRAADHRDIVNFDLRRLEELPWVSVHQLHFLGKPDYILRISADDHIVAKLEEGASRLSMQLSDHQGVDPGDLSVTVAESRALLRKNIEQRVFGSQLTDVSRTSAEHIRAGLASGKIQKNYNADKEKPFVYQKDLARYHLPNTVWIYMDNAIVWRSRLQRKGHQAILETHKLFVLERREQSRLVALVTDRLVIPQHGGRFFYFIADGGRTVDDLHTVCAMINSAPINFYYRVASQGNKDVLIRPLDAIAAATRQALAASSKLLHALMRDRARAEGGGGEYETEVARAADLAGGGSLDLLDDGPWWTVEIDGPMSVDCYVERAHRNPSDQCVIDLNARVRLTCSTVAVADALYAVLKDYEGDLLQMPPVITSALLDPAAESSIVRQIDAAFEAENAKVDDLVSAIYGLTARELGRIRSIVTTAAAPASTTSERGDDGA